MQKTEKICNPDRKRFMVEIIKKCEPLIFDASRECIFKIFEY